MNAHTASPAERAAQFAKPTKAEAFAAIETLLRYPLHSEARSFLRDMEREIATGKELA